LFRAGLILSILCLASTAAAQTPALIVYPAGQYLVTTPAATSITWTGTSVTLSWAVATPTPIPPRPNPPAPPAPTPHVPQIVGTIYAIALSDGQKSPLEPDLKKLNAHWYSWTTQSNEAACWLEDKDVKATGYPALLLVTANAAGNAVLSYITKLPNTEDGVVAVLTAARTKGGK